MSIVSPMTRVLKADEIGIAPHNAPRLLLPDPRTVFQQRARRLHYLADGHDLAAWLLFCHALSLAQGRLVDRVQIEDGEAQASLSLALTERSWGYWQALLAELIGATTHSPHSPPTQVGKGLTPEALALVKTLQTWPKATWQTQAQALLLGEDGVTPEAAPFLGAALQVEWTLRASQLPTAIHAAYQGESAVCPVCGSHPMVSLVHTGDPNHGVRYLVCTLCQSQWQAARAKCTNCDSPKEVVLLGPSEKAPIQGECCEVCQSYVKLLSLPREVQLDPCADDLATLGLDVMLEQEGYGRAARNLLSAY